MCRIPRSAFPCMHTQIPYICICHTLMSISLTALWRGGRQHTKHASEAIFRVARHNGLSPVYSVCVSVGLAKRCVALVRINVKKFRISTDVCGGESSARACVLSIRYSRLQKGHKLIPNWIRNESTDAWRTLIKHNIHTTQKKEIRIATLLHHVHASVGINCVRSLSLGLDVVTPRPFRVYLTRLLHTTAIVCVTVCSALSGFSHAVRVQHCSHLNHYSIHHIARTVVSCVLKYSQQCRRSGFCYCALDNSMNLSVNARAAYNTHNSLHSIIHTSTRATSLKPYNDLREEQQSPQQLQQQQQQQPSL